MKLGFDAGLARRVIVDRKQVGRKWSILNCFRPWRGPTPIQMPVWACDMAAPTTRIQIAKAVCDFTRDFLSIMRRVRVRMATEKIARAK